MIERAYDRKIYYKDAFIVSRLWPFCRVRQKRHIHFIVSRHRFSVSSFINQVNTRMIGCVEMISHRAQFLRYLLLECRLDQKE